MMKIIIIINMVVKFKMLVEKKLESRCYSCIHMADLDDGSINFIGIGVMNKTMMISYLFFQNGCIMIFNTS